MQPRCGEPRKELVSQSAWENQRVSQREPEWVRESKSEPEWTRERARVSQRKNGPRVSKIHVCHNWGTMIEMTMVKEDFCVIVFDGWGARSNLGEKTKSLLAYGVLLTAWWSDSIPCHKHCTRLSPDHNRSCAISDLVGILTTIMKHTNIPFLSIKLKSEHEICHQNFVP